MTQAGRARERADDASWKLTPLALQTGQMFVGVAEAV